MSGMSGKRKRQVCCLEACYVTEKCVACFPPVVIYENARLSTCCDFVSVPRTRLGARTPVGYGRTSCGVPPSDCTARGWESTIRMGPELIKTGDVFTPAGYYYYGMEAPHELAHWSLFFQWMAVSVVACALIMGTTRLLLPRLAPVTWAAMVTSKPHQAIAVPKNVTEWWPAFVTPALVWRDVRLLTSAALTWPQQALHLPPPPGMWAGAGACLGYMVFDCLVMIIWRRELRKSMGGAMFQQM